MKKIISLALVLFMFVCALGMVVSCGDTTNYIGVQNGTTGQYFVDGDADWDFTGIDGYASKGYTNGGLAVTDMKNGNVKYVIIDKAPALQLEKSVGGIKVINIELTTETYAFGVDKAQNDLLASINNILETKHAEIKAIVEKYAKGDLRILFFFSSEKRLQCRSICDIIEASKQKRRTVCLALEFPSTVFPERSARGR